MGKKYFKYIWRKIQRKNAPCKHFFKKNKGIKVDENEINEEVFKKLNYMKI